MPRYDVWPVKLVHALPSERSSPGGIVCEHEHAANNCWKKTPKHITKWIKTTLVLRSHFVFVRVTMRELWSEPFKNLGDPWLHSFSCWFLDAKVSYEHVPKPLVILLLHFLYVGTQPMNWNGQQIFQAPWPVQVRLSTEPSHAPHRSANLGDRFTSLWQCWKRKHPNELNFLKQTYSKFLKRDDQVGPMPHKNKYMESSANNPSPGYAATMCGSPNSLWLRVSSFRWLLSVHSRHLLWVKPSVSWKNANQSISYQKPTSSRIKPNRSPFQ